MKNKKNKTSKPIIPKLDLSQLSESPSKTFEADIGIVNIGIWLFENGHFQDRLLLLLYYSFVLIMTLATKIYFVYLAYK
jgi:hypothetical protein